MTTGILTDLGSAISTTAGWERAAWGGGGWLQAGVGCRWEAIGRPVVHGKQSVETGGQQGQQAAHGSSMRPLKV